MICYCCFSLLNEAITQLVFAKLSAGIPTNLQTVEELSAPCTKIMHCLLKSTFSIPFAGKYSDTKSELTTLFLNKPLQAQSSQSRELRGDKEIRRIGGTGGRSSRLRKLPEICQQLPTG